VELSMNACQWMVNNMNKIKSYDELKKLNTKFKSEFYLTKSKEKKFVLAVGMATCGIAAGAVEVTEALKKEILANNLTGVTVSSTGCLGYCYAEPVVEVRSSDGSSTLYGSVDAIKASRIIKQHIIGGVPLLDAVVERSESK